MRGRTILFWCHLSVGVGVGAFVVYMAATGSLLALEPQIVRWAESSLVPAAAAPAAACLTPGGLMAEVQTQTGRPVAGIELSADRRMPVHIQSGKEDMVLADPCTGRVLPGGTAPKARAFLRTVKGLHESATLGHAKSGALRQIKNAANVGFSFLIVSGLVLWIPRKWHRASLRAILTVRPGLRGRARDWNLHNTFGFWLALPLAALSLTGVMMSYPWLDRGPRPQQRRPEPLGRPLAPEQLRALDGPIAGAMKQAPGWNSLRMQIAGDALMFAFDEGTRPIIRVDRASGRVLAAEPSRITLRGYAKNFHTGRAFGLTGQLIALAAALTVLLMAWTGLALALRRFNSWRARRGVTEPRPKEAVGF